MNPKWKKLKKLIDDILTTYIDMGHYAEVNLDAIEILKEFMEENDL